MCRCVCSLQLYTESYESVACVRTCSQICFLHIFWPQTQAAAQYNLIEHLQSRAHSGQRTTPRQSRGTHPAAGVRLYSKVRGSLALPAGRPVVPRRRTLPAACRFHATNTLLIYDLVSISSLLHIVAHGMVIGQRARALPFNRYSQRLRA